MCNIVDKKTLKVGDIVVLQDCVEISVMNVEAVWVISELVSNMIFIMVNYI